MDGWMRMEYRSSDSDKGKSKYSEENPVPVPLWSEGGGVTMLTVSMCWANLLKSQTDVMKVIRDFYIRVTVQHNEFLCNKTNQMH